MSDFIEDDGERPSAVKQYARWALVVLMMLCVYQIGASLYAMKQGEGRIWAVWGLIMGSFFFLVVYAVYWLLKD